MDDKEKEYALKKTLMFLSDNDALEDVPVEAFVTLMRWAYDKQGIYPEFVKKCVTFLKVHGEKFYGLSEEEVVTYLNNYRANRQKMKAAKAAYVSRKQVAAETAEETDNAE